MPANRLAHSLSPYLLQHADNPVDWYPWGDEALARSRDENKPIFLSIGYSACHWCHVMAHESFENPTIAAVMNKYFVNIKLDREERPDLDEIYMTATQAMTGQGGWPMSVFLTPDLRPFFAGTYFPPDSGYGRPGFQQLLQHLAAAWDRGREEVVEQARQLTDVLQQMAQIQPGESMPTANVVDTLLQQMSASFDSRYGGFAGPPKFPDHQGMLTMMGRHAQQEDLGLFDQVATTLEQMALGGIYDQLGGGFARYSVDARWLVPHFEKMLYDNACLAQCYLAAWQLAGDPLFRQVVEGTLDYVLREMTDTAGGFYSAQDADSEGVEGKFFVWSPSEVREILGDRAEEFMAVYDVSETGNFEGLNILNLARRLEDWEGERPGIGARLADSRSRLKTTRDQRVWPGLDDKVLVEWNGLMIKSLALCGAVLQRDDYVRAAADGADFIRTTMWAGDRLHRVYRRGEQHTRGTLADYAAYADGLLELFCATTDLGWLVEARRVLDRMVSLFLDEDSGAFFFAEEDPALLVRSRHPYDNPYPSGNTLAVRALRRMARLTGEQRWSVLAEGVFTALGPSMERNGLAHAGLICSLQDHLAPQREIVICGLPGAEDTQELARVARSQFYPDQLVLVGAAAFDNQAALVEAVPLFAGRLAQEASAYVCRDKVCRLPISDPAVLAEVIG